jgi:hypothetical protein
VDNIDLLVPRHLEDLARVAGALRTLNARVYVPGLSDADAQALPDVARASFLTNTKLTRWMTDAGPVKVLLEMRDRAGAAHTFEHYARTARAAELFGLPVLVAELDDVLGSNERTQRSHPGIPELRRLVRQAGTSLPGLRSG